MWVNPWDYTVHKWPKTYQIQPYLTDENTEIGLNWLQHFYWFQNQTIWQIQNKSIIFSCDKTIMPGHNDSNKCNIQFIIKSPFDTKLANHIKCFRRPGGLGSSSCSNCPAKSPTTSQGPFLYRGPKSPGQVPCTRLGRNDLPKVHPNE